MAQTTLLNTVTLSEFTDLVRRNFVELQKMVPMNAAKLYIQDDLSAHSGNTKRYNEVDTETYASDKPEGADAAKASVGVGYTKDMVAKRIAREVEITFEMRRYNRYPDVVNTLTSLSWFCPQRSNIDLTHRLTFCNASSYVDMNGQTIDVTGGDGNPIVFATHSLAFSATTWRNRVVGDPSFSQGALEAAELLTTTDILSNFGERRVMVFNAIVTSDDPTTCRIVKQLLESTADVDAVQAGIVNIYKGAYTHIELPLLATTATGAHDATKKHWWFLASIGQGQMGWQAYYSIFEPMNLKTPAPGNNGEDVHNDNWTYGTRMSYGICAVSGRGLIGSLAV